MERFAPENVLDEDITFPVSTVDIASEGFERLQPADIPEVKPVD